MKQQTIEQILAGNIRAERARLQLSQKSLRDRMTALGYRWHTQTVSQVEAGTRRVTAEETMALALAFETVPRVLYRAPPGIQPTSPDGTIIGSAFMGWTPGGKALFRGFSPVVFEDAA